jgi:hypothetical protein
MLPDKVDFRIFRAVWLLAVSATACFKHKCFSEEEEWRWVDLRFEEDLSEVKIRESAGALVPYVELSCAGAQLPIRSVRVGPSADPDLALASARVLLKNSPYSSAKLIPCDLPYRPWP